MSLPRLSWVGPNNKIPICEDLDTTAVMVGGRTTSIVHRVRRWDDDDFFGCGEVAGAMGRRGRKVVMEPTDPMGYDAELCDPLYKHFPVVYIYSAATHSFYGIYYETSYPCEFDFGHNINNYLARHWSFTTKCQHSAEYTVPLTPRSLSYFIVFGSTLKDVVTAMTARVIGTSAPAPLWALGYLGSAMGYTDSQNAQSDLEGFVRDSVAFSGAGANLCTGFHLSSGYSMSDEGKRYVFEWNGRRVPDPPEMVRNFLESGIRLIANIKPALLTTHPDFVELAQRGMFVSREVGGAARLPALSAFWGGVGAHLDFLNPETEAWWERRVTERLLEVGVQSTWNDNNEYVGVGSADEVMYASPDALSQWIFPQGASVTSPLGGLVCYGGVPFESVKQIQALRMTMASQRAQAAISPPISSNGDVVDPQVPYLITRCGTVGHHRIASTWSGDNHTSWKTLRFNLFMGINLCLSGWNNIGHDVGGFAGPLPSPQLLFRWVQLGVTTPRFTIHSWKPGHKETSPWMFGEEWGVHYRSLLELRDALWKPTFFSLLMEAHISGGAVLQPWYYSVDAASEPPWGGTSVTPVVQTDQDISTPLPTGVMDDTAAYEGGLLVESRRDAVAHFVGPDIFVCPVVDRGSEAAETLEMHCGRSGLRLPPSEQGWVDLRSQCIAALSYVFKRPWDVGFVFSGGDFLDTPTGSTYHPLSSPMPNATLFNSMVNNVTGRAINDEFELAVEHVLVWPLTFIRLGSACLATIPKWLLESEMTAETWSSLCTKATRTQCLLAACARLPSSPCTVEHIQQSSVAVLRFGKVIAPAHLYAPTTTDTTAYYRISL